MNPQHKINKKETLVKRMEKLSGALQESGFAYEASLKNEQSYLLFDATSRVPALRLVSILSLACTGFLSFLILQMTEESMISELGSIAAGRALQVGLLIFSNIYLGAVLWLSGKYVLTITRLANGNVQVTIWRMFLPNKISVFSRNNFTAPVYTRGRFLLVRAPYYTTRTGNRKLIIDKQGDFPMDEDMLLEAISTEVL